MCWYNVRKREHATQQLDALQSQWLSSILHLQPLFFEESSGYKEKELTGPPVYLGDLALAGCSVRVMLMRGTLHICAFSFSSSIGLGMGDGVSSA